MLTAIGVERSVGSWVALGATRKIKFSIGNSLFWPSQRPLLAAPRRVPVCALSMAIIILSFDFFKLNFMNTVDILILVCIESSLCLVAFFGFFRFLIGDSVFFSCQKIRIGYI